VVAVYPSKGQRDYQTSFVAIIIRSSTFLAGSSRSRSNLPAMDPRDLKSTSNYVNNQLASRGLVRGLPIDFAKPSKDPDNPARIINLVHELVQRRDVCH